MKGIERRLAKLEAGRSPQGRSDLPEFDPETYAAAYAHLTRLLSTHPTNWPPGEWDTMKSIIAGLERAA